MHALELIIKISSADSNFSISKTNVKSPQQKNGYDCGPYIMLFANKIADNLKKGTNPNNFEVSEHEASGYRKELREKILLEMKKVSVEPDTKRDDVCWRYINYMCWRGENCHFRHPTLCESLINGTSCGTEKEPCNLYHPQICYTYQRYNVCKWGDRCKFRHIDHLDYMQRRRDDRNYVHPQICYTYQWHKECKWRIDVNSGM